MDAPNVELILAASKGDLERVQELVKRGVDPSSSDYDKRTALHLASAEGHLNVVTWLVGVAKVDVNPLDRFGHSPLVEAKENLHDDVFNYLLQQGARAKGSDVTVHHLLKASATGDVEEIKKLIALGVDVNTQDYDGRTALHASASAGHKSIVEFLLEQGAHVEMRDKWGGTPLSDAQLHSHKEVAEVLLKAGAQQADPAAIKRHPHFRSSIQRILSLICAKEGFIYGVAWLDPQPPGPDSPSSYASPFSPVLSEGGRFQASSIWYAPQGYVNALSRLRKLKERGSEKEYVKHVVESKKPLWVADPPAPRGELSSSGDCGVELKTAFFVPVVYADKTLAVLDFRYSEVKKEDPSVVSHTFSVVSKLAHGLQNHDPSEKETEFGSGIFREQMDVVYRLILNERVFNTAVVKEEVEWFYNQLGLDPYYFNHFPLDKIAHHLHCLIAAKKLALTTGTKEKIELSNEEATSAFYIRPSDHASCKSLEQRIEQAYLGEGYQSQQLETKNAVSLHCFHSKGTASKDSDQHIALYFVEVTPFISTQVAENETDLSKISTGAFLRDKTPHGQKKYKKLIDKAVRQLSPVVEYHKQDDGGFDVFVAYRKGNTHSFFSSTGELLKRSNLVATKKYVNNFSNGIVVISLYFSSAVPEENIKNFTEQLSLVFILPRTSLSPLFDESKLTIEESIYAYAAWKFAYHFMNRRSAEYVSLWNTLDESNRQKLLQLKQKLRSEVATETRCLETLFTYHTFLKEAYADFAAHQQRRGDEKMPSRPTMDTPNQKRLREIITKTVSSDLDQAILNSIITFNAHILKTNFYKKSKLALSFRLDPAFFGDSDFPDVPFAVFMFVGSDFRGFHLRFEDIARGGIRMIKSRDMPSWVRNVETLLEENYGLAHTQQRKNKDIPEGGSKGTILLSQGRQDNALIAFKKYIDALLDLLLPNEEVVDHYGQRELVFCGPDEGTADFMDWAALHAKERGYAHWSAFTTGKSTELGGIPHDLYGMTTRGVHQYVLGVLQKVGLDEKDVTKIQTGGPDGDLGSNEIKISYDKTIAVVDGSGVLYDPHGIHRDELFRLADTRKMVNSFDKSKLSKDGFLILLDDKDVTLPDGTLVPSGINFRNNFHLHPLARATLFVPCGGRPEAVNIRNVHELFDVNEQTGVKTPRFKYIVEGANLFFTEDARKVLEKAGVVIIKDASANKGGVTSSSLEVLAALALTPEEHEQHMRVKEGKIPQFYADYVKLVQQIIESNARQEFECIWNENERKGTSRVDLSNILSNKINTLNNFIKKSNLWEKENIRVKVFKEALPPLLVELVGFDKLLNERIPENYLKAIFSKHLASHYVYQYGSEGNEFSFF